MGAGTDLHVFLWGSGTDWTGRLTASLLLAHGVWGVTHASQPIALLGEDGALLCKATELS